MPSSRVWSTLQYFSKESRTARSSRAAETAPPEAVNSSRMRVNRRGGSSARSPATEPVRRSGSARIRSRMTTMSIAMHPATEASSPSIGDGPAFASRSRVTRAPDGVVTA